MGVTIHFSGRLRDESAYIRLLNSAMASAAANEWLTESLEKEERKLLRVDKDENDYEYIGPTKGIQIYPHEDCEPVRLEFDRDLVIQEYTKTQFAGAGVHIQIVNLLREIEPYFEDLNVQDEGEYWETKNETLLAEHISNINCAIEEYQQKDPQTQIKIKTETGRILDLLSSAKE